MGRNRLAGLLLTEVCFFFVCFGLGYTTLNRYDPRLGANYDSTQYYELAAGHPLGSDNYRTLRLTVPYLAIPFARAARGRVKTWDPVFFGLLVANSIFVSASAVILVQLALVVSGDAAVSLLAGTLLLLNFMIPNEHLAGMVDSSELFTLTAAAAAMLFGRWRWLPILGIFAGLSKETAVPLLAAFAGVWALTEEGSGAARLRKLVSVTVAGLLGVATVCGLRSAVLHHLVWPWQIAGNYHIYQDFPHPLRSFVLDTATLLSLWCFVPFAVIERRRFPRPWIGAVIVGSAAAIAMGLWNDAGPNINRPVFNVAGPCLALATALFLVRIIRKGMTQPPRELASPPGN